MVFKAGYRRLPNELVNYIWSYDNRYKLQFKDCLFELIKYFYKNRLVDILKHEVYLYDIYSLYHGKSDYRINLYGYNLKIHQYILKRLKRSKKEWYYIIHDNLKYHNLRKIQ